MELLPACAECKDGLLKAVRNREAILKLITGMSSLLLRDMTTGIAHMQELTDYSMPNSAQEAKNELDKLSMARGDDHILARAEILSKYHSATQSYLSSIARVKMCAHFGKDNIFHDELHY